MEIRGEWNKRKSWSACFESHFICNTVLQNVFLGDFTNGNASFFHLVPLFPIGSKDPVFLAIVDMPCNERSTQDRNAFFYHQSIGLCRRWVEANLRIRQCWWCNIIKWWELWTRSRLSWLNIKSRLVERRTLHAFISLTEPNALIINPLILLGIWPLLSFDCAATSGALESRGPKL